jgi:hypothetical protein
VIPGSLILCGFVFPSPGPVTYIQTQMGYLFLGVSYALVANGEHGFGLRQAGTVVDLADSVIAAAFAQVQPRGRRMRNYVSSDWLLRVRVEHAH